MRKFLSIVFAIVFLMSLAGCRGKQHPVLYGPGDTQVWPTLDAEALERQQESLRKVELVTSMGTVVLELFEDQAPVTVENFLDYVEAGFYSGTIFHRVQAGQVVQGGGFTVDMDQKRTNPPIRNEASNGLRNLRGTVGIARTMDMNSATAQFYVNLVDNPGFNGDGITGGYAVFGRVYEGMSVIDAMALVDVGEVDGMQNVPVEPILILSARVLE
ncbi:MAG: peptidylprolyl isomerase [Puniceicoccaceae bacterium]